MPNKNIQITFNGVDYDVHPDMPLIWVLFVVRHFSLYQHESEYIFHPQSLNQYWMFGRCEESTQDEILKESYNILIAFNSNPD